MLIKNVLKLASGTGISQIINLLSIVYLANAVGAESFGIYSIVVTSGFFFSAIAGFRLELAIQTVKSKERKQYLFSAACISSFICYIVLVLCLLIAFNLINYNVRGGVIAVFLVSTSIFVFSINQLSTYLHVTNGDFNKLGYFRVLRTIVVVSSQIVLLTIIKNEIALIAGYLIGNLLSGIFFNGKYISQAISIRIKPRYMWKLIGRYKKFPQYQMPLDLLMMLNQQLPMIFIIIFLGPVQLGIYALATKLLQAPITLLSLSLKQALYHMFGNMEDVSLIDKKAVKITAVLILVVTTSAPVYYSVVNYVFPLVLGEEWTMSLYALNVLFPMFAVIFCSTPATTLATMCSLQDSLLIVTIINIIVKALIMYVVWYISNSFNVFLITVALISIAQSLYQISFTFWKVKSQHNK